MDDDATRIAHRQLERQQVRLPRPGAPPESPSKSTGGPTLSKPEFDRLLCSIPARDHKHPCGLIWTDRAVLRAIHTLLHGRLRGELIQSAIAGTARVDERTVRRSIKRMTRVGVEVLTTRPTTRYDGADSVLYYEINLVRLGQLAGRRLPTPSASATHGQGSLFTTAPESGRGLSTLSGQTEESAPNSSIPDAGRTAPASTCPNPGPLCITESSATSVSNLAPEHPPPPRTTCPRPPADDLSGPLNASPNSEEISRASLKSVSVQKAEAGREARDGSVWQKADQEAINRVQRLWERRRHTEPTRPNAIGEAIHLTRSRSLSERVARVFNVDCDATRGAYEELDRLDGMYDWVFEIVMSILARAQRKRSPRHWFNRTVWDEIKKRRMAGADSPVAP